MNESYNRIKIIIRKFNCEKVFNEVINSISIHTFPLENWNGQLKWSINN